MIEGYLDESGIHDGAAICIVAGYFGGRGQWKRFEKDWLGMLQDFEIPLAEFHAKDIFPKPKGYFHPTKWNGNIKALQNAIAETIAKQTKIRPVTGGIIVNDFNSFPLAERRYFTGAIIRNGAFASSGCPSKPYFVPFVQILERVCEYANVGGKAHFFFGVDRPFYEYATTMFKQIGNDDLRDGPWAWKKKLGTLAAPKASETPQLQAADFLANLTYHHMLDARDQAGIVPPSPLLAKCISNMRSPGDFFFQTKQNLQASLVISAELSIALRQLAEERSAR
jgi:hypothetical protein